MYLCVKLTRSQLFQMDLCQLDLNLDIHGKKRSYLKKKMPPKGGPVDYSMWDLLINDDYGKDL